jgi:SSS family solute:Na+ symporter
MHPFDWFVIVAYFGWILYGGIRRSRNIREVEGYFLANRSLPWWAVGLSVMATQLSAVTLVGTTGRGYAEGMSVVQLYLGLPIAMVILSMTVVPFFYRSGVYTAYEYLERRFDVRTRTLAAVFFLLSRALSCGVTLSAPGVILSVIFGWNVALTVLAIGVPAIIYTMIGGVQAVTWADVKQMAVIVIGVGAAAVILILGLPDRISVGDALHLAGSTGRLQALDFTFDLSKTYTFWSGILGGLFLMLSYFGTDQSQVQRYLTAKSVDQGRSSLLLSAFVKIPLQFAIPLIGILMFAFYVFQPAPMLFNGVHDATVKASPRAAEYATLEQAFHAAESRRREAAERYAAVRRDGNSTPEANATALHEFRVRDVDVRLARAQASQLVRDVTNDRTFGDVNYVFPTFITQHMPIGLVGLIIAAIFAASMSAASGELNALATASVIDIYRRHIKPTAPDAHYLTAARIATTFWGILACLVATYAASLGPLIDVVNRFGSFFYGSLLGVFALAIGTKTATSRGAFYGLLAGMAAVAVVAFTTNIAFLWHNIVGAVTVVIVGLAISALDRPGNSGRPAVTVHPTQ